MDPKRFQRQIDSEIEAKLRFAREESMRETDMNSLPDIKRKLNAFRIRLEYKDFKNAIEEACIKAKVDELYSRCRKLAPDEVQRYEDYVRKDIRKNAKKDLKRLKRHRR